VAQLRAIQTPAASREEAVRIEKELEQLKEKAEFPIQVQPVEILNSQAKLKQVAVNDTDLCILYAAGYCTEWPLKVPMMMFVRHRSGPFYLGFESPTGVSCGRNGDQLALKDFDAGMLWWTARTNCSGGCGRCTA